MRWRAVVMAPWAWLGLLRTVERQDLVDVIGDERISKRRRRRLRGKGKVWCPVDYPDCHADVLLKRDNQRVTAPGQLL